MKNMLTKFVLDRAKAFLCWEKFPELTVKLVELKQPVAFYYPPSRDYHTIVLFYPQACGDFSEPLFLLFHECGHYLQFQECLRQEREQEFWRLVNIVNGSEKSAFEQDAWERGTDVLEAYLRKERFSVEEFLERYRSYGHRCLASYHQ